MEFILSKIVKLQVVFSASLLPYNIKKAFYQRQKEIIDKFLINSLENDLESNTYTNEGLIYNVNVETRINAANLLDENELKTKLQEKTEFYQNLIKNGIIKPSNFKAVFILTCNEDLYQEQILTLSNSNDLRILTIEDFAIYVEEPDYLLSKHLDSLFDNMSGIIVMENSNNYKGIKWKYKFLKGIGYDIEIIFISESLNTLQKIDEIKNTSELQVAKIYEETLECIYNFQNYLKSKIIHLVHNKGVMKEDRLSLTYTKYKYIDKIISKFISEPIKNPIAKVWIDEKLKKIDGN